MTARHVPGATVRRVTTLHVTVRQAPRVTALHVTARQARRVTARQVPRQAFGNKIRAAGTPQYVEYLLEKGE